jgi:hypothetical protein
VDSELYAVHGPRLFVFFNFLISYHMNYESQGRTSYFRVKDEEKFLKFAKDLRLEVVTRKGRDEPGVNYFCLLADEGFPTFKPSEDGVTENDEIDITSEIANHLYPGEIAIIFENGREGMRYLSGYSTAVDSNGSLVCVNLDDIYNKAADFFGKKYQDIPQAQY